LIYQTIEALQILADIIGSILLFLKPIVSPIGQWMVGWINVGMQFLRDNFSTEYTFYIIICVTLVVLGVIVNIIWPGDRVGSIFSKSDEKIEEIGEKGEESGEKEIIDEIRRCKDCGNPIGDSDICPLCGARNE
jgi:hypothetical protein